MPAIQVARTDTFEQQRQKINEIGEQVFNVTAGGSDLSTGNLKLGDGTRSNPSLAFVSDPTLGLYKPEAGTIRYIQNLKKIFDIKQNEVSFYRNVILEQSIININGLSVTNSGSNYDPGSYSNIPVIGGTGDGALLNIEVVEFTGSITNSGKGYVVGTYSSIPLAGGSGSGATVSFLVPGIEGDIQNPGSGYLPGLYTNIPLTNGSGSGALADIIITGDITYSGSITNPGSNYTDATDQLYTVFNVPSNTFTVGIVPNGTPPPDNLYTINGVTQQTLTLVRGRTYRFDLSSSDLSDHPFSFQYSDGLPLDSNFYTIQSSGDRGNAGAFVDLIINDEAPTGTIVYYCESHAGMGGTINITTGTSQNFGTNGLAQVTASGGSVTSFTLTSGNNYEVGDTLQLSANDSGGSGFVYTISNITYTGAVSGITIVNSGSGYNELDVLSISDSSVGGVGGSGFQFLVESDPQTITNLSFDSKGQDYASTDVLTLPGPITGLSANLRGTTSGITATLTSGSVTATVSSTANIIPGMTVETSEGDTGTLDPGTTVVSVNSSTQITLSQAATASGSATLTFTSENATTVVLSSVAGILPNSLVTVTSGSGSLPSGTTISFVDPSSNSITLSQEPTAAGSVTLSITPPYGDPVDDFNYTVNLLGVIETVSIGNQGNGYEVGDVLSISSRSLTQPINVAVTNKTLSKITFTTQVSGSTFSLGNTIQLSSNPGTEYTIYYKKITGGFIEYILVDGVQSSSGETIFETGTPGTLYTIDSIDSTYRWFFDGDISPNITLYVGNTYSFNLSDSSNIGHSLALSRFADGIYKRVDNVSTTLTAGSPSIVVGSTTNILPGMLVEVSSGDGQLIAGTTVQSIDSATQITLSSPAFQSGSAVLSFSGTEYLDGVTKSGSSSLTIVVSESTPSTLYYYCSSGIGHENEGGYDGEESIITVSPNNPKVFGSGAEFLVAIVDVNDVVTLDANTASLNVSSSITTQSLTSSSITNNGQLSTQQLTVNGSITATSLVSSGLSVTSPSTVFSGDVSFGTAATVSASSGNILSAGEIKALGSFNSNDALFITNSTISSSTGNNISLNPSTGRVVKVNASTAITIPVGSTSDRPPTGVAESGSIRFNTETGQYEGYNQSTTSWSSLGGVRDLDGNTFITAEETIGSNDNTLWFYNDNINTVKFTPTHLEFRNVNRVKSTNVNSPAFTEWTSNTPVTVGQYLKYRNNLYEVTIGGVTGSSGSEPTHTSGALANGTAELTWSQLAVAPLTFEDIEIIRIGPLGGLPVSINSDLRLQNNIISTDINDLIIKPNFGKKVVIESGTTLALPSGPDTDRGIAIQGSVRFSTTTGQFEGYDGANWGSLGGVKDVDQNTYIIPELSPGSNENILYFVNDNTNTLQVTTTALDFYGIDTIRSVTSDELEITASLLTFDNGTSAFDNTQTDSTFLHTTKQYFDIGLSAGLTVDPVLRLDNQGDVYLNIGFGTGVINPVKIFDGELKEFELADIKITTDILTLVKGTSDNGSSLLYELVNFAGSKTTVIAQNLTSGEKEFIEFGILDDGTDVYHTEYGNIRSGNQLIIPSFELTGSNTVVLNIALGSDINPTESVKITIVSNLTKK